MVVLPTPVQVKQITKIGICKTIKKRNERINLKPCLSYRPKPVINIGNTLLDLAGKQCGAERADNLDF